MLAVRNVKRGPVTVRGSILIPLTVTGPLFALQYREKWSISAGVPFDAPGIATTVTLIDVGTSLYGLSVVYLKVQCCRYVPDGDTVLDTLFCDAYIFYREYEIAALCFHPL